MRKDCKSQNDINGTFLQSRVKRGVGSLCRGGISSPDGWNHTWSFFAAGKEFSIDSGTQI
jgi:hypothetical protein